MKHGLLHHVEYYVNDLVQSNLFWDPFLTILGYKKTSEWSGGVSWTLGTETYLVFVQVKEQYLLLQNNRQAAGLNHIAICCDSFRFPEIRKILSNQKLKILTEEQDYLCFEDPNEFCVEVYRVQ